ncbi:MAG: signal peptide peptidase SppA [Bacteroidales bacterium]|nr:signal peptide peptidase SppA [Bacteroidales bacterium]
MKRSLVSFCLALALVLPAGAQDFLKGKVLKIDMTDTIDEVGSSGSGVDMPVDLPIPGLSGSKVSLLSLERALEKASKDKEIAMVYLNYEKLSGGFAVLEELRESLARFSESGKPVVAYGASLGNGSYYIASVADRVFLHPKGSGTLNGIGTTQFFLKDLLDTLGVEVQLIRHGKFKSAGEMYIRNSMSPENRRQYDALLSSLWKGMTEQMASSRGVSADSLRSWISDLSLGTADTWVEKGLVDGLKYKDEMEQYICHLFGTTDPDKVKRVDIREYAKKVKPGSGSKVAVLYADGEISRSGNEIAGEKFAREVEKVRKDESIKAVVFRVNSPGGEVVAADMIRREIELLMKEKPVIASYGAYAASGGYLISAACNKIYVDNSTLTGSIGVFGMVPNLGGAVKKVLKVNVENVGTDTHSGLGNMFHGMDESEIAWYQKEIEGIYDDFVNIVASGRSMTYDQVDEIAQGRVWSGADALVLGLADKKGTLLDAVAAAAEEAGLSKYKLVCYPEKKSFMKSMMGSSGSKDLPLIRFGYMFEPGYKAIARMPLVTLDPEFAL